MALARVVTFEGVSSERMDELQREISGGQPPEGFPSAELIALHDPEAETSTVIVIVDSEEDYQAADAILSAMPAGDTPGRRTSVTKHNVALRMKQ